MEKLKSYLLENYGINEDNIKDLFKSLSLAAVFYFFPLISSDIFLYNDFEIALTNQTNEASCGRYFADFIFSLLSFNIVNFSVVNTSPLNQILGIVFLVFCVSVFFDHLFKTKPSILIKVVAFSFIASPFLLRNFSWRILGIMSILSLCFALLASMQFEKRLFNIGIGSILVFLCLGFFQTGVNVFLAATFFLFLVKYQAEPSKAVHHLQDNIAKLVLGFAIYTVIFNLTVQDMNGYCKSIAETFTLDDPFIKYTLSQLQNVIYSISYTFFSTNLLKFFTILTLVIFAINYAFINEHSLGQKLKNLIVVIFSYSGMIFSLAGCLILLKQTLNEPRHFMAFAIFLSFLFYAFYKIFADNQLVAKGVLYILIGFFFFTSYSYSAAFRSQDRFNHSVGTIVKNTLLDYDFRPNHTLSFDGYVGYSPSNKNTMKKYRLLEGIMFYQLGNSWFSSWYFKNMGLEANYDLNTDSEDFKNACKAKTLYGNAYFKIAKVGDFYLVAFKEGDCYQTIN